MEIYDFAGYYKTISNAELLSILENPDSYQPLAIEAAKKELSDRHLNDEEIMQAKAVIDDNQKKKQEKDEARKQIGQKIISTGDLLVDTINPIHSSSTTVDKKIRTMAFVFFIIFLCNLVNSFRHLKHYAWEFSRYPIAITWDLFPLIILPISLYTFWKRRMAGWVLFTIYLTFSFVGVLIIFVQVIAIRNRHSDIDTFLSIPRISTLLLELLFFGGAIYVINQREIRETYSVSKGTMIKALVMTGTLTFLIYLFLSLE